MPSLPELSPMHSLSPTLHRHPMVVSGCAGRGTRTPIPHRLHAGAQMVLTRPSAITRTFVRSQETAAVAG